MYSTNNNVKNLLNIGGIELKSESNAKTTVSKITPDELLSISDFTSKSLDNNKDILSLFPDTELAIQILVSSILSPNDMSTPILTYKLDEPNDLVHIDTVRNITNIVSKYIKRYHNIESKLPDIIRESLMTVGSFSELIIPQSALATMSFSLEDTIGDVDSFINNINKKSNDSKLLRYSDTVNVSLENLDLKVVNKEKSKEVSFSMKDLGLENLISESYQTLKLTDYKKLAISMESRKKIKKREMSSFYKVNKDRMLKNSDLYVPTKKESEFKNEGKPLVMKLSAKSVVPIHSANNPKDHLAYFILIDENGTPITSKNWDEINGIDETYEFNSAKSTSLIKKASDSLKAMTDKAPTIKDINRLYEDILESKIRNTLESTPYSISEIDTGPLKKIIFGRILKNRKTRLLFVPKELLVYYAFRFRDNGTGESLLETTSVLSSMRAILLFSKIMSVVTNSINETEISAVLDEDNLNVNSQIEMIKSSVLKTRHATVPFGLNKVGDISSWAREAGLNFKFEHPSLPNIQISKDNINTNKTVPDTDADEQIQELILMSFGLTPEMVMSSKDENFATSLVTKNALLAKRVTSLQNQLLPIVRNHIEALIINDEDLLEDLREIISSDSKLKKLIKEEKIPKDEINDFIDDTIEYLIGYLEVSLPRPEVEKNSEKTDAFNEYSNALSDYLDAIIEESIFPEELISMVPDGLDGIKFLIKHTLLKQWSSANNYMTEVTDLFDTDINDDFKSNILDPHNTFKESFMKMFTSYIKKNKKLDTKAEAIVNKIENEEEEEEPVEEPTEETTGEEETEVEEEGFNEESGEEPIETEVEEEIEIPEE